jgi:hypothetical protein
LAELGNALDKFKLESAESRLEFEPMESEELGDQFDVLSKSADKEYLFLVRSLPRFFCLDGLTDLSPCFETLLY